MEDEGLGWVVRLEDPVLHGCIAGAAAAATVEAFVGGTCIAQEQKTWKKSNGPDEEKETDSPNRMREKNLRRGYEKRRERSFLIPITAWTAEKCKTAKSEAKMLQSDALTENLM